jgi:hypothetical protein
VGGGMGEEALVRVWVYFCCGGCLVRGYWVLWSLCMFGCISVIVEGACVRGCRGLELYAIGTVG